MTSPDAQTIPVTSTGEEYTWPLTITESTGKDISVDVVKLYLMPSSEKWPPDDAAWLTPDIDLPQDVLSQRVVQLLIGGTGHQVDPGVYLLCSKVNDTPEAVIRKHQRITVT